MWFLKDLARVDKERSAIATLIQEVDWLTRADWDLFGARLCLIADIEAHGRRYPARMIYPASYPASPPTVIPREANQHWSEHQYGHGGELCLEWGPDNWREDVTGADALRSAHRLLYIENPTGEEKSRIVAPSRHALTLGQELKSAGLRFIANETLVTHTQSLPENTTGIAKLAVFFRQDITAFTLSLKPSTGEEWENPTLPQELERTATRVEAPFLKTTVKADELDALDPDTFINALEAQGLDVTPFRESPPPFALVIDVSGGVHLFGYRSWIRFHRLDIQDRGAESRLSPEFMNLRAKKVGIVGLGSAGSKIAISLARSEIRKFVLVDHDIFLPENLCRHELNWEEVGQHKVDGVAHQLNLIVPGAEITRRRLMLSGQEATASVDSALSQLGECDLIIDATADPSTFNQLSAVACQYKTPLVWLEIFAGGIGGLMARYRPGRDSDPQTIRAHLIDYLAQRDAPDIRTTADYTAVSSQEEPVVASDADVSVIAAHTARMALDILLEHEPPIFPFSLYLIGLSRAWIFEQPFYTIPIDLSNVEATAPKSELSAEKLEETVTFLVQLIDKTKNENPSVP